MRNAKRKRNDMPAPSVDPARGAGASLHSEPDSGPVGSDFHPNYGPNAGPHSAPLWLGPGLRCVLAPNPSPMTGSGTNTYIIGEGSVAVIDPGPQIASHLAAIRAALREGEVVSHIIVTHAHYDHSALAPDLARQTGAELLAFGDALAGRTPLMQALAEQGLQGGEGVDLAFTPDRCLRDGAVVSGESWSLTALHTPGHMSNHLCLDWNGHLFSGDHVMGWSTTFVSPPDGDMGAYMASLERLAARDWKMIHPGHGAPVAVPADRLAELIAHRKRREAEVLAALRAGLHSVEAITGAIYADLSLPLQRAAARNVLSHLLDLAQRGMVRAHPGLRADARFELA